jgi:hypothetical protein
MRSYCKENFRSNAWPERKIILRAYLVIGIFSSVNTLWHCVSLRFQRLTQWQRCGLLGLGKEFCLQSALEGLRFAMCWLTNAQCSPWPGNGEKMRSGLACPHNDNCPWG